MYVGKKRDTPYLHFGALSPSSSLHIHISYTLNPHGIPNLIGKGNRPGRIAGTPR
jgi:hypothetical protein